MEQITSEKVRVWRNWSITTKEFIGIVCHMPVRKPPILTLKSKKEKPNLDLIREKTPMNIL
jgi:hypothetical protein